MTCSIKNFRNSSITTVVSILGVIAFRVITKYSSQYASPMLATLVGSVILTASGIFAATHYTYCVDQVAIENLTQEGYKRDDVSAKIALIRKKQGGTINFLRSCFFPD